MTGYGESAVPHVLRRIGYAELPRVAEAAGCTAP